MEQIAILASGKGSNAGRLCTHFSHHPSARIRLIACDHETAGVYDIALLRENGITFIVLAGYLRLIPKAIVDAYPKRIINLHPALLPKFGGKGMHGMHVHEAVFNAGEKETGITVHFVNEKYDEGDIIAQFSVHLESGDSPQRIAEKIAKLEATHFPETVEKTILQL
jgi:phosphoribosylglycinamide formyltransferase-1